MKHKLKYLVCLLICALNSFNSFAISDTLKCDKNWHFGVLLQNQFLNSSSYANFTFYTAGISAGYRSISVVASTNVYDKNKFIKSNYNVGSAITQKYPHAGYGIGLILTPLYNKKQTLKVFYTIQYMHSTVYLREQNYYPLMGYNLTKTTSYDDEFTHLLGGFGLMFNIQNKIGIQTQLLIGSNTQSYSNSHVQDYYRDPENSRFQHNSVCAMLSFSLFYNFYGHN